MMMMTLYSYWCGHWTWEINGQDSLWDVHICGWHFVEVPIYVCMCEQNYLIIKFYLGQIKLLFFKFIFVFRQNYHPVLSAFKAVLSYSCLRISDRVNMGLHCNMQYFPLQIGNIFYFNQCSNFLLMFDIFSHLLNIVWVIFTKVITRIVNLWSSETSSLNFFGDDP